MVVEQALKAFAIGTLGALCSVSGAAASSELVTLDAAAQVPGGAGALLGQSVSDGWFRTPDVPVEGTVSVVVALRLPEAGVARLHSALELGDPELRWDDTQLNSELSPPRAARDITRRWLTEGGGHITAETSRFIIADFDATATERCFGVQLQSYVHRPSGQRSLMATESTRVPADVKPLVELVAGLNRLPRVQSSEAIRTVAQHSTFQITPSVIGELYALPKLTPASSNVQGIAAFNNESFTPADLAQFQNIMHLPDVPVNHTIGPATLSKGGTGEGSLDVQYMMGVSPHVPTVVWATAVTIPV